MSTKIKICGMRRPEDIEAANQCRPDYIGFICSSRFWRYIPEEQAAALKNQLRPEIRAVGVFVDEPYETIADYLKKGILDMVQLHGHEDEYYIRRLKKVMVFQNTVVPVIKAFQVHGREDVLRAEHSIADYVLLDAGTGSGKTFDWNLIGDTMTREYFLAGGLGPDTVADAIQKLHPFAVDMSSGVETDKKKDPEKMTRAVEAVRNIF